jgi:hypothetical protein
VIQHVVVVKFKPEAPQPERAAIVAALRALPAKIAEIRRYEVGLDVLRSERSYDLGIVSAFDDLAALNRYQVHPAHAAVAQRLRAASANLYVVDYDLEAPQAAAVGNRFEKVVRGAVEKLMGDERLRSNLSDDEANILLDWLVKRIEASVSKAFDESAARQIAQAEVTRLRASASKINDLLVGGKLPALPEGIKAMGLRPTDIVTKPLDRAGFIRAMTAQLSDEWKEK